MASGGCPGKLKRAERTATAALVGSGFRVLIVRPARWANATRFPLEMRWEPFKSAKSADSGLRATTLDEDGSIQPPNGTKNVLFALGEGMRDTMMRSVAS
jgi:hypothetical protein